MNAEVDGSRDSNSPGKGYLTHPHHLYCSASSGLAVRNGVGGYKGNAIGDNRSLDCSSPDYV